MKISNQINIALASISSENDEKNAIKKRKVIEKSVEVESSCLNEGVRSKLQDVPILKPQDIEKIKQSYHSGTYQINYEKIADKLIQLDRLWF